MPGKDPIAEKMPEPRCPGCQEEMERGFVLGRYCRLRWADRPDTKTILSTELLRIPFSSWNAPSYEGYRCTRCGLALFSYDA